MARHRLKLYGKRAKQEDILLEIHNLLFAKGERSYPLKPREIAEILGFSYKTVYNYIAKLSKTGRVSRAGSTRYLFPKTDKNEFREFSKHHQITSDPLVSEWIDDLLTRKQGLPLKSWKARVRSLETVCNTCQVVPSDFTISSKNTEKIMRSFAKLFQRGEVVSLKPGQNSQGKNTAIYSKVQGVRDFCSFYGITWRKGVSGVMSQKILGHGKYADIRFTDDEFERADKFIKEKWGLDSDIYRWFWIGVESCARFSALYNMGNDYTIQRNATGKIIYIMTVHETKTDHIRGGKWTKYISRADTQKSLDLLRSRGVTKIHESNVSRYKFQVEINQKLSQIYKHLGKNTEYFSQHSTHALRHIGAHYWLSKTNYNYGIISEVGGWNTIDELKKSYGQIPPEKILEIIQ